MQKKITIAIDGYAACGKSTLAKALAKTLNYTFIDSGAMYRAFALKVERLGLSASLDGAARLDAAQARIEAIRLDAEGRAAFLETSTERNVALYRRHGFEIIADYKPSPTGPQTYGMWRNAT